MDKSFRFLLRCLIGGMLSGAQASSAQMVNVRAWGNNGSGQCNVPPHLTNAVRVAAAANVSYALRDDGTVLAWGVGGVRDMGLSNVVEIAAFGNLIALRKDGTVFVTVTGDFAHVSNAVAISSGQFHRTILLDDQTILAAGYADSGQVHIPAGLPPVIDIESGYDGSFAITEEKRVISWNWLGPDWGQFDVPPDLREVASVSSGATHTLALRTDGTVVGWGDNSFGQISIPAGLDDAVQVSAGWDSSLILKRDGTILALGNNEEGQTDVPPLPAVLQVSCGASHNLVLVNPEVVVTPPVIGLQPRSITQISGRSVYFWVTAIGISLSYQWYHNSEPVEGATNRFYRIDAATTADAGEYTVNVINDAGNAWSEPATLNVVPTLLDVHMVPAISLIGDVNGHYQVEYLNVFGPVDDWKPLTQIVLTNSPQIYIDTSARGHPQRHYRLRKLP